MFIKQERKKIESHFEVSRRLQERGVDFVCHFVGDGRDREALSTLVDQAGLTDKIRFLGRLSRDEIAQLLLDADVLAAPSVPTRGGRRVGIPVVLMEAMGSGVPVVASNILGIPELVKDKIMGLLVPPRDATLLTDALETYYKEPGQVYVTSSVMPAEIASWMILI